MNKGLEVIEAHSYLAWITTILILSFIPKVLLHSLIELQDTSVLAQLGWPDMRLPLLYALSWPERIHTDWQQLDLVKAGNLTFKNQIIKSIPVCNLPIQREELVVQCLLY
jgi:1-deoxy-D-xylulose-5-phosphate reductoisomerase